jgi:hypothetical protein
MTGSSVAPKIDVALCHYGRQPSFFFFFLLTEGWMNEGEQQATKTRVFVIHPTVGIICSCPDWSRPHPAAVQPFIHLHELRARRKYRQLLRLTKPVTFIPRFVKKGSFTVFTLSHFIV